MKAAFVALIDQSRRTGEDVALRKVFKELIEDRGVNEFILSYHGIEYTAKPILDELQSGYPQVRITHTQEGLASADIYIVSYYCSQCTKYKTCDREATMVSRLQNKIPGKPYIMLQDYFDQGNDKENAS